MLGEAGMLNPQGLNEHRRAWIEGERKAAVVDLQSAQLLHWRTTQKADLCSGEIVVLSGFPLGDAALPPPEKP
jgi:hypothetical protein